MDAAALDIDRRGGRPAEEASKGLVKSAEKRRGKGPVLELKELVLDRSGPVQLLFNDDELCGRL